MWWRSSLYKLGVLAFIFVILGLAYSDERLAPWLTIGMLAVIALGLMLDLRRSRP